MQSSIFCGMHEGLGAGNLDRQRKPSDTICFAIFPNEEKADR